MNYKELSEAVNSPTLQRDLKYWEDTGETPAGYLGWEFDLMSQFLFGPFDE
jgi:hypothetical protein